MSGVTGDRVCLFIHWCCVAGDKGDALSYWYGVTGDRECLV